MHFLRVQENYESPNPKFRNHQFRLVDFMDWYVHKYKRSSFTYPSDWGGFNVPSYVMDRVYGDAYSGLSNTGTAFRASTSDVPDWNRYDDYMFDVHMELSKKCERYYLIGTSGGSRTTLAHEMAHGLFYMNGAYREEAEDLVRVLPKSVRARMNRFFTHVGYARAVFVDETQAYMSTGLVRGVDAPAVAKYRGPFETLYRKYVRI